MGIFGGSYTSGYRNDQADAARRLGGLAPEYDRQAQDGAAGVETYDPQYKESVDGAVDALQGDKYTDSYGAAQVAKGQRGIADSYAAAMAKLKANNVRRGIGGGVQVGAEASIENARAGAMATARNNVSLAAADDHTNRAMQLARFLGGVRSGYRQEENQGLGAESSLYDHLFSTYGNMASMEEQRKAQERAQRQQAIMGALSAAGQFATL